ncbi:hypothetical protein K4043_04080 [Stenotrophomonas sp. SRS1]|uniref:hypothetical protein n=1 Tax=Stenotrophomonas sp. SRS1 TaxID=2870345 RepID=UPI0022386A08|nr:hypothetical protein [Stenotrophomonas sp. SRS1]MCW6027186.1 hypothetical protein [Stenotrophomonas sp. SRS1]
MDIHSWGPAGSGVVGGIIATWLVAYWARGLQTQYRGWSRAALRRRHRTTIRVANILLLVGLFSGLALYLVGGVASNDHRPAFLCFGLSSLLPLLALIVIPFLTGRSMREAFVAFALGQGAPVWATYPPLAGGLVCLVVALVGFLSSGS